ncbi:MAG: RNA polymerase sigma-70 factor, partial [Candidatus Amulumruptor sp.]|nr:RNA polymerase sigma-70 factor [Candidatus Amulumruptor sp.]
MELSDIKLMERLFYSHYKALRAYAFRFVNDLDAAEDIVQDAFMGLWENRDNIDDRTRMKSYLFRSVYNRSINYLSSKKVSNEEPLEQMIDQINLSAKSDSNQEDLFMAKELKNAIMKFVGGLSPNAGIIFEMSREQNMKIKEIADAMNLSP